MLSHLRKHHDFMWGYTLAILKSFARPSMVFLIFLTLTLISLGAGLFYWVEAQVNPQITGFFDALYFAVTVMTSVGLGDLHPVSTAGKIVTMGMMILGTGIFISFTAIFAAAILEQERLNRSKD